MLRKLVTSGVLSTLVVGVSMDIELAESLMGKKPINPLGSCFDSAGLNFIANKDLEPGDRLCHGIGVANMPGQEGSIIGHAWIEFTKDGIRLAYDAIWGVVVTAERFRSDLQISYCVEYTIDEVLTHWGRTDYSGPWDSRILDVTERVGA